MDATPAGRLYPCFDCARDYVLPAGRDESIEWMLDHMDGHAHERSGPLARRLRELLLDVKIDFRQMRSHPDWPRSTNL